MRGAHATSNYGTNVAGFRKAVFTSPGTIAADSVTVHLSRSVTAFGTWDLAAVKLTGVSLDGAAKLPSAGFWLSVNPITGEMGLAFNPSIDSSLAPVSGFAGDINLPRAANGQSIDLTQMSKASGTARAFAVAATMRGAQLVSGASIQTNGEAGLTRDSLIQALDAVKSTIETQESKSRYFDFLRAQNVEWIALTVPIFTDSLADPTVRVKYQPAPGASGVYTFEDDDLRDFIVTAKRSGFKVVVGFEFYPVILEVNADSPGCGTPQYKPNRWLLGQPVVSSANPDQACINPADWWWSPSHPLYAANAAIFWNSYTQIAVKYAAMAQETGVDIYLLSTEQDNLFRTRPAAAPYTHHFRAELTAMVAAVRAQYSGLVSYERLWTTLAHPNHFANGAGTTAAFDGVFEDLGLDVIPISAYFDLADAPPTGVMSVAQFEAAWEGIFTHHLVPLQARYPGKRIFFSEWGYTNDIGSPFKQGSQLDAPMQPGAAGAEGITQQRNIIESFFNVNARHGNLVSGGFFWGLGFPNEADCQKVTFGVYCKPASAQALAAGYGQWLQADVDRVFDWAQQVYPQYFPGTAVTQSGMGYLYRFYPATGTYLGVRDGRVYVHNGAQFNFLDVGSLRTFLDAVSLWGY